MKLGDEDVEIILLISLHNKIFKVIKILCFIYILFYALYVFYFIWGFFDDLYAMEHFTILDTVYLYGTY